ncbi:MAG TPA: chromosome segregation protein SMC [Syntrophomonadaceae bacterium]|nr:chromosome segregation protein SMC [Syntrophomonadaceae bacterium]
MYLKRLEIQGFKSFAERVNIEFEKGITVIVGPNGCGKSNITDAVQWVLGEQSARSLRGYRMDDVIFSGTSRRRPHGMAEVSLTFDNRRRVLSLPYEEISITRRVYRSGEGEYFINKQLCRLRDIRELFAQCGISRAAFSITSQGKIDEFTLVRPQERRVFIEEIAGVSSYRQRKSDTIKRLRETDGSLARLEDLLIEMNKRRLPLQKQAEVAEQYRRFAQDHRETELRLLEGQLVGAKKKEDDIYKNSHQLESFLGRIQETITILEKQLAEFREGMSLRLNTIEQKEEDLSEVQRLLQESHSDLARLEEKVGAVDDRRAELEARIAVIVQRKAETEQELAEAIAVCKKLKDLQSQAERDVEDLLAEKKDWEEQKKEANRTWESVDQEIFEVLHQKTALVSELQVQKNKKEVLARQREALGQKTNKGKTHCTELEAKIREVQELCKEYEASQEAYKVKLEKEESLAQSLTREQEEYSSKLQSLSQKTDRLQVRFQVLKDAEENQEGYQYGVKRVLQALAKGVKFDGDTLHLVEELMSIPSPYGTALDTALGRAAHHFICKTPKAAQEAIALLKREKGGRASFFPLQALDHRTFNKRDNVVMVEGVIGRLSDLVICEERYKKLAEYLLGRTYLADNIQHASSFAEKNNYRYRVVTMDGELIQAGGLFTGGRVRSRYPSTRRRKQEIKELETQIIKERQKFVSCKERAQELKLELEQARNRIHDLREKIKQIEEARRNGAQRLSTWRQELKHLADSTETYRLEGEELLYHQQDFDEQISMLERKLESIAAREREAEGIRAKLEKARRHSEDKTQELMSRLSAAQVSYSTLSQDLKHQEQKRKQLQQLLEMRSQEFLKMEKDQAALHVEKEINQKQEKSLRGDLDAWIRLKEKLNQAIASMKKQVVARERYVNAKEKRYIKLKEVTLKSQQRLQNNSIKLQHLNDLKEQILSQANENNLKLDLGDDVKTFSRREELALKKEIAAVKQEMEALGEINFAAPGEYQEVQDRIAYLEQQIEDLEDGKRSLTQMIDELDRIAEVRFQKTFRKIRADFQEIFSLLSEGGRADLLLTEEDDLLETGVDICVVPRGKKPRHLSLLSGGEKSLTGIAFLFAMLQSNPSPFYLLDEVEAFLDEANLVRFANFLRGWSADCQLILISHRYQTMEIADHLYGVTMEEPGISKLVTVQLGEYNPENDEQQYIS